MNEKDKKEALKQLEKVIKETTILIDVTDKMHFELYNDFAKEYLYYLTEKRNELINE